MELRGQRWRHYTSISNVKSADFQPQKWNCTFNVKLTLPKVKGVGKMHTQWKEEEVEQRLSALYVLQVWTVWYVQENARCISQHKTTDGSSSALVRGCQYEVQWVAFFFRPHTCKQLQQVIQAKEKWMATSQPVTTCSASVSAKLHWHMQLAKDAKWCSEYSIL